MYYNYIKGFVIQKLGIDKAIFYTLLGKGLQMSTAAFTVLFIVAFLSPNEQGYYYTFGSIVAIQVFFELGLTGIITQFVAHEASHLKFCENRLEGDGVYKSRLASLLKICAKWYSIISISLLFILLITGLVFFTCFNPVEIDVKWRGPWVLLACGTVMNFLITPVIAIIEGLGKVKEVAKFRMVQQMLQPIVLWGGLWMGADLYVLGMDAICRVLLIAFLICKSPIYDTLLFLWKEIVTDKISYRREIFPYQWRIAISWISGYFIFQLFNPVLFATDGPVVAGQMGMTMQALNALQALTLAWISTKTPTISGFIALKKYEELNTLFSKTFKQVVCLGASALVLFVAALLLLQEFNVSFGGIAIGDRFLPALPLILMAWSVFSMFPVNCWAIYLRSHKREPLMVNSVVMGIICCTSTLVLGNLYGVYGIVIGFACLRLVSLIWIRKIFKKKKAEWHKI